MGEGVGDLCGLALGRGDGFWLAVGDGDGEADGDGTGSVGITVNVGIGDCGAAGIWSASFRECAAATAERINVAESPMTATVRRQCVSIIAP